MIESPPRLRLLKPDTSESAGTDIEEESDGAPVLYVTPDAILVSDVVIHHMVGSRGLNPLESMVLVEVIGITASHESSTVTLIADPVLAAEWASVLATAAQKASEDLLRIQQENDRDATT